MKPFRIEPLDSPQKIEHLRQQYLNELYEAQELFLEMKVQTARPFLISVNNIPAGYFFLDKDSTLLEYYVIREHIAQVDSIFEQIIRQCALRKALCKSFDHPLLSCCMAIQKHARACGVLFRECKETRTPDERRELRIRFAESEDEPHIAAINEEVFEHDDEIRAVIKNRSLLIFENAHDIVGFGIFQRIIPGRPEFDIGMLVDRKYRRQGYGSYIIRYLAEYCRRNGDRPICGCAIENVGSRRCLENAGYIARYRLLEFTF